MKIKIRTDEIKFTIPVPNIMLLNKATSKIAANAIKKHSEIELTAEQISFLSKNIKKAKKVLHKEPLFYVKSGNREEVIITL